MLSIALLPSKEQDEHRVFKESGLAGISQYLCMIDEDAGDNGIHSSAMVSNGLLHDLVVAEDEAWFMAMHNVIAHTVVKPLQQVMSEIADEEPPDENVDFEDAFGLYVVTNTCGYLGASALLNKEILRDFAEHCHTDSIVVLPSSVHEVLIANGDSVVGVDELSAIVHEVNETQVLPMDRLADKAFVLQSDWWN